MKGFSRLRAGAFSLLEDAGARVTLCFLAIVCVYTVWRSLSWPLLHDAPLMHYIAWRILSGDVPYRDIFDMNMPGVYALHCLVISVLGRGDLAWRLFDLLWLGFIAGTIALFCRPFGRFAMVLAPLLFVAAHLEGGPQRMGQRDFLVCPFLMLGVHVWARSLEDSRYARTRRFLAGLIVGAGMMIKPFALFLLPVLIVAHLAVSRRLSSCLAGMVFLGAGVLVVPALTVLWLWHVDALASFWEILGGYLLPFYGGLARKSVPWLVETAVRDNLVVFALLPLVPLLTSREASNGGAAHQDPEETTGVESSETRPRANGLRLPLVNGLGLAPANGLGLAPAKGLRLLLLAGGAGYGLLHFVLQGKGWTYHRYPLWLFLLSFCGVFLAELLKKRDPASRRAAGIGLAMLVLFAGYRCLETSTKELSVAAVKPKAASLIKALSGYDLGDEDTVQVLDVTGGGIHALYELGVRQPTRFIYAFHFFHGVDQPVIKALRAEFMADLAKAPPRLIVVFDGGFVYEKKRLPEFPELEAFLNDHYEEDEVHHGYTIYRRTGVDGLERQKDVDRIGREGRVERNERQAAVERNERQTGVERNEQQTGVERSSRRAGLERTERGTGGEDGAGRPGPHQPDSGSVRRLADSSVQLGAIHGPAPVLP